MSECLWSSCGKILTRKRPKNPDKKNTISVPTYPPRTSHELKSLNPGLRGKKQVNNILRCGLTQ